jgi:4-alpha-glucanotransferase
MIEVHFSIYVLPVYTNIFGFVSVQDVDYEATMATKLSIAKKIFTQEKDLILNSKSFQKFFSENEVLLCSTFFFLLWIL